MRFRVCLDLTDFTRWETTSKAGYPGKPDQPGCQRLSIAQMLSKARNAQAYAQAAARSSVQGRGGIPRRIRTVSRSRSAV